MICASKKSSGIFSFSDYCFFFFQYFSCIFKFCFQIENQVFFFCKHNTIHKILIMNLLPLLWTVCGCSCLLSSLIFDQFFDVSLAWTSELFGVETLVLVDNISSFLGTFPAIFGCPLLFFGIQIIAVFSFFSFFFLFSLKLVNLM